MEITSVESRVGMGMGLDGQGQDSGNRKVREAGEKWSKAVCICCLGVDVAVQGSKECGSGTGT